MIVVSFGGHRAVLPPLTPMICPVRKSALSEARKTIVAAMSSRSEEHTSELQSRLNLVCRLLLEKKKKNHIPMQPRTSPSHDPNPPPPHPTVKTVRLRTWSTLPALPTVHAAAATHVDRPRSTSS